MEPKYKRVLLKVSGEALAGEKKFGIDDTMTDNVAKQIKAVCDLGVEMAIVDYVALLYLQGSNNSAYVGELLVKLDDGE